METHPWWRSFPPPTWPGRRLSTPTPSASSSRTAGPHGDLTFECGGSEFGIYETPSGGQAAHTLASFKVSDLDAEMAGLRGKGVVFEEYDLPGLKTVDGVVEDEGMRAAWFKDSEGNILCLNERTAG